MNRDGKDAAEPTRGAKLFAAGFYAVSSILIMAANKVTLTTFRFPSSSTVALAQMVVTIVVLRVAKAAGAVQFPDLSVAVMRKVFPLPLIYLGNMVTGLSGTKALSLPMFTVLRRFSILFTLLAETFLLSSKHPMAVKLSVFTMLMGALIAAADDLAFDATGYAWVFASDLFTAMNGVYIKKKLDTKDLGRSGLMFYNCLCSLPVVFVVIYLDGSVEKVKNYEMLSDPTFQAFFITSSVMGCVLTYAVFLCTQVNSALTTAVVGCLKNVLISYGGMFIGGDYIFSLTNFAGLNVSVMGSVYYSYLQIVKEKPAALPVTRTATSPVRVQSDRTAQVKIER